MAERFWESLRLGFMQLRSDCAIDPPLKPQGGMSAVWSAYPPPGEWNFEHFKRKDGYGVERRFIWHARNATARLKFIGDEQEALSFWLNKVRQDAPDAYLQIQRGVDSDGAGIVWVVEILDICGLSAEYCRKCEADETNLAQEIVTEASEFGLPSSGMEGVRTTISAEDLPLVGLVKVNTFGKNVDRLRKECGWSFDDLAKATDLDKKLILGHVNEGKGAHPKTLETYARTFTEKMGRTVTVAELES